jgi:hypothetical protein
MGASTHTGDEISWSKLGRPETVIRDSFRVEPDVVVEHLRDGFLLTGGRAGNVIFNPQFLAVRPWWIVVWNAVREQDRFPIVAARIHFEEETIGLRLPDETERVSSSRLPRGAEDMRSDGRKREALGVRAAADKGADSVSLDAVPEFPDMAMTSPVSSPGPLLEPSLKTCPVIKRQTAWQT